MNASVQSHVQWVTASPLWQTAATLPHTVSMQQPALLRFTSDTFMDDLSALLQSGKPTDLAGYIAAPVSYQARPLGVPASWEPPPPPELKLYQPAHGHFTLVAASLVCRMAGLPDRVIDTAHQEKTAFVLRRLDANGSELAWVTAPQKGWQPVARGNLTAPNEELLPLSPITFAESGRRRRLLVGLVPTAGREAFQAAPALALVPAQSPLDARADEVHTRVVWPLTELKALQSSDLSAAQKQETSRFILLDLADFLAINAPSLWNDISTGLRPTVTSAAALYDTLVNASVTGPDTTWQAALKRVWAQRAAIVTDAPATTLPALDVSTTSLNPVILDTRLKNALRDIPPGPAATGPATEPVPKFDPGAGVRYVLRCIFRQPNCGPVHPDLVSAPSVPFAIASFFDFDAPARPIRITMPVDSSPAGLRKFNKNVAFLISNKLRQQMQMVTDLKGTMDGELQSGDGIDIGVMCSFSIPIITICALILLILIVNLLNIVFWWLPFFRICLPINFKKP